MCGIVGAVGKINIRKFLIDGLFSLDYRGYDSAGVAFLNDKNKLTIKKVVGRVEYLDKKVPEIVDAKLGIGHTRWATHGVPSIKNSHPQVSMRKYFCIVHNGVIENYRALKTKLLENGFKFESDTDTEVVANLLEYNYLNCNDILEAIRMSIEEIKGSFAIAVIFKDDSSKIYFMKRRSPLCIGLCEEARLIGSDVVPMINFTNSFLDLRDDEYGFVSKSEVHIFKGYDEVKHDIINQNIELLHKDLDGYPNYMLKEIEETPDVIKRLIDNYFDGESFLFDKKMIEAIRKADDIIFLGCGTSYHAALSGVRNMNYLGKRSEAYIASEWAYFPTFTSKKPLYILISQSGETADLLRCQQIINDRGSVNIAITNTKGSTLDRESTFTCLLFAGLEVAVASTKAFSAQVAFLSLLTGAIEDRNNVVEHLRDLNRSLTKIISRKEEIESVAKKIEDGNMLFFIGRGQDYDAAQEASLKMKEITYLHCEAFPGGELKHGPIAVVDSNTRLIAFSSSMSTDLPIRNNVTEIESRGAKTFIVTFDSLAKDGDSFVIPNVKSHLSIIPMVFVSQYLAYFVALHKGVDIDKPRNLAKSVTVE
ncbi:MAG TPA: glutamine--fructose-6-phosphate transaminase (isomerizing) [Firmicutes bacterium]|nr:glutamine--fructose-6-phosphate transaminase (isomerizing) [Bacillota bacterium]